MRGLACVLLVLASTTAGAHPRRPPNEDLIKNPFDAPVPEPCPSGKSWKPVETCLGKQQGAKIVYNTPALKVVQTASGPPDTTRLWLYIQSQQGAWSRAPYIGYTSAQSELLGVASFTAVIGAGVRIDTGTTARSTLVVAPGMALRGVVRRVSSTVCMPTSWGCRTVVTACDAYVRGHLLWSFHSQLEWEQTAGLRLRVDTSQAGGTCTPPRSMVDEVE